jgi:hypothetical protein
VRCVYIEDNDFVAHHVAQVRHAAGQHPDEGFEAALVPPEAVVEVAGEGGITEGAETA